MKPTPVDGAIPQSPQSVIANLPMYPALFPAGGCPLTYAGDAPGLVEGIVQINCRVGSSLGTNGVFSFATSASYALGTGVQYQIYIAQ